MGREVLLSRKGKGAETRNKGMLIGFGDLKKKSPATVSVV